MAPKTRSKTAKPQAQKDVTVAQSSMIEMQSTSALGTVIVLPSLNRGANFAKFDYDKKRYVFNQVWESEKPFSLEITTVTNGEFKNHQAAVVVPVPQKYFNFFGLPREIRDMVYTAVLTKPGEYIFFRGLIPRRILRGTFSGEKTKIVDIKILSVCRQAHDEAIPVLYGKNAFHFDSQFVTNRFLTGIGDYITQLQELEIDCYNNSSLKGPRARSLGDNLAMAERLRRVYLGDWWRAANESTVDAAIKSLKPFMRMILKRDGGIAGVFKVLNMPEKHKFCLEHWRLEDSDTEESEKERDIASCDVCSEKSEEHRTLIPKIKDAITAALKEPATGPLACREDGRPKRTAASRKSYVVAGEGKDDGF
ncbi:hypothetical protein MBLNU459_g1337t1 [Dothideomycetes sp. NU459]